MLRVGLRSGRLGTAAAAQGRSTPVDSKKAPKGTVRGEFGTDVEKTASHGSDAPETARAEIAFFFPGLDLPGVTATP